MGLLGLPRTPGQRRLFTHRLAFLSSGANCIVAASRHAGFSREDCAFACRYLSRYYMLLLLLLHTRLSTYAHPLNTATVKTAIAVSEAILVNPSPPPICHENRTATAATVHPPTPCAGPRRRALTDQPAVPPTPRHGTPPTALQPQQPNNKRRRSVRRRRICVSRNVLVLLNVRGLL